MLLNSQQYASVSRKINCRKVDDNLGNETSAGRPPSRRSAEAEHDKIADETFT